MLNTRNQKARHNPLYWVVAALGVALLPQLLAMPVQLALLTLLPIAWRVTAELRRWKPPKAYARLLFTGLCIAALVATYGNLLGRRTAVSMLAVMLALKLLETFKVRDARIVASLSLFMCATQFLFNQGPIMLLYGAACMVLSLAAFALLARGEAFAHARQPAPGGRGVLAELKFTSRLVALAVPVAIALFVFFPRWGSPLWGVPERSLDARSGLSDSMTPGSIQSLFMDDSPAFRADFDSGLPQREHLYWRGPVLWGFDGRTWSGAFFGQNVDAAAMADADTAPYRYTVQLEPTERRSLFALDYPAMVPPDTRLTLDHQLLARRPITSLLSYQMASDPQFLDSVELPLTIREMALRLPPEYNPQTREMMGRWRSETTSDTALVRRALEHFNQENFRYTLNPPLLTRHSVDEFLFDTRAGFCEHYASAFTVMMRMAGIPARVVTGYQGGWFNEFGQYVLVRQSDAHAWSEVWLPGVGWTRIDPTAAVAPSRVEQGALDALGERRFMFDYQWVRQLRNGADWLGRSWNNWVIAFDTQRQSRLLEWFGLSKLGNSALVLLLALSFALTAVLMAPWLLRLRARASLDPAQRAWQQFRHKLARGGVDTSPAWGPMELAATAGGLLKQQEPEIRHIADLYLHLRYSGRPGSLASLQQAVGRFKVSQ
jgi:transglutaminase-like putative cysteine protease